MAVHFLTDRLSFLQQNAAVQKADDDLDACESVEEFLDVYGLWEMRGPFEFHKIDDMEVVVRLERCHIALISDRVGIQVCY